MEYVDCYGDLKWIWSVLFDTLHRLRCGVNDVLISGA